MPPLVEQTWTPLSEVYGPAEKQLGPLGRLFSHELDSAHRGHEREPQVVQDIHRDLLGALAMAGL